MLERQSRNARFWAEVQADPGDVEVSREQVSERIAWSRREHAHTVGNRRVSVPGRELVLQGRHRFASYALIFRIEDIGPRRSRLRAESRAAFPGRAGRLHRRLVIGTGGHVVGMRRLLSAIRRRSE
jgi:hypothetical protein